MRRTTWGLMAVAAMLAAGGCAVDGTSPEDAASPGPTTSPEATASPEETLSTDPESRSQPSRPSPLPGGDAAPPPRVTGEVPGEIMDRVVEDAAALAGVPAERVEVVRDQRMQWRDGSWGCPEPGMMYTQAIVDGYWVELRAGSDDFDYRLDGHGNFRLCDQPQLSPPTPPGTDR